MIIRLSGADFSANNIGKIDIKELTDETKTILMNFTRSITTQQKYALQDFISGMKDKGLYELVDNLYLPVLMGSVGEALINVKTLSVDGNADNGGYVISGNNGLKKQTGDIATVNISENNINYHIFAYNTEPYDFEQLNGTQRYFYADKALDGVRRMVDFNITGIGGTTARFGTKIDGNMTISNSAYLASAQKLQGFVFNNGVPVIVGASIYKCNVTIPSNYDYSNLALQILAMYTSDVSQVGFGLLSIGKGLSNEQIVEYQNLVDIFMANFI